MGLKHQIKLNEIFHYTFFVNLSNVLFLDFICFYTAFSCFNTVQTAYFLCSHKSSRLDDHSNFFLAFPELLPYLGKICPKHFCSSQPSMVHWLSSPIFPCPVGCLSRYGDTRPNLTSSCPKPIDFRKAYDNSCSKIN